MRALGAAVLTLAGCDRAPGPPPPSAGESSITAPPESLALRAPGNVEVWYTLARPGRAADGRTCVDRGLEIRAPGGRIPVPLLYTGTSPELVNDTTIRARLSEACEPGQSYVVDLRTGRPTPER